jgi:hypothetical protein
LLTFSQLTWAQSYFSEGITYQGRIISGNGVPLENPSVQFVLEILSPDPEQCILYYETQTLNMSGTSGYFTIIIGKGTRSGSDPNLSFAQIFQNTTDLNVLACAPGYSSPYTHVSGASRKVRVKFNDGSQWVSLDSDYLLTSVPQAVVAQNLQNKTPSDFIQVTSTGSLTQANVESIFSSINYSRLTSLLSTSPTNYLQKNSNGALELTQIAGDPSSGGAAGQLWYDSVGHVLKFNNGTGIQTLGVSGAGITNLTAGSGLLGGTISEGGHVISVNVGTSNGQIASGNDARFWSNNGSNVYRNSGNVGIGTTTPIKELDVIGEIQASGHIYGDFIYGTNLTSNLNGQSLYGFNNAGADLSIQTAGYSRIYVKNNGATGIGNTAPTAKLHITAGTSTAGNAPLKFTSGTLLSTPENGVMEYDGSFWLTSGGTRRTIASSVTAGNLDAISSISSTNSISLTPMSGNSVIDTSTTASTGTGSGALIVYGGVGIGGAVNVGGTINAGGGIYTGTLYGGNNVASANLTIDSTSNGTKGNIILAPSSGSIGIGTSNPSYKLDLRSDANSSQGFRIYNADSGASAASRIAFGGSNDPLDAYIQLNGLGNTSHGGSRSFNFLAHVGDFAFLSNNGTPVTLMTIKNTGNVGIGTSSPMRKLEISGNNSNIYSPSSSTNYAPSAISPETSVSILNTSNTDGSGAFLNLIANNATPTYNYAYFGAVSTPGISSSPSIVIGQRTGGSAYAERLRIDASGNVGIGTTTPSAKLDVRGSSGATLKIIDGNEGSNKVLTSDSSGQASWQALPSSGAINRMSTLSGGSYSINVSNDSNKFLLFTGATAATLYLPNSTTAGTAFVFAARNASSATVLMQATASQYINGLSNFSLAPGHSITLFADGNSNWYSLTTEQSQTSNSFTSAQSYTSNGVFTPPAGVYSVRVTILGAGGGGAGSGGGWTGGGGGGGAFSQCILSVVPSTPYTLSVGIAGDPGGPGPNGGSGGVGTSGSNGSLSSFGSLIVAGGGSGAIFGTGAGGPGGSLSGSQLTNCTVQFNGGSGGGTAGQVSSHAGSANYQGGGGGSGASLSGGSSNGTNGAAGGAGGAGGVNTGAIPDTGTGGTGGSGNAGSSAAVTAYGAGGGGAGMYNNSNYIFYYSGGSGAPGFVYVEW